MLTRDPFELGHIFAFAVDHRISIPRPKTGKLDEVAQSFNSNISRLQTAMLFPALSGHFARYLERCITLAEIEITGKATTNLDFPYQYAERIVKRARKIMEEADQAVKTTRKTKEDWDQWIRDKVEIGAAPTTLLSAQLSAKDGVQAFLASFITGGWTAFETMAADLWEESLNAHPHILSSLKGTKSEFFKKAETIKNRSEREQSPDQRLRLDVIERYGFNLKEKMGTALRGDQRFDSLGGIREAYARAFSDKFANIESAICDTSLDCLNVVRNAIVHRGGLSDETYRKAMKFLPIPSAEIGRPIPLTGKTVAQLLAPMIDTSVKLVGAIDSWIDSN